MKYVVWLHIKCPDYVEWFVIREGTVRHVERGPLCTYPCAVVGGPSHVRVSDQYWSVTDMREL